MDIQLFFEAADRHRFELFDEWEPGSLRLVFQHLLSITDGAVSHLIIHALRNVQQSTRTNPTIRKKIEDVMGGEFMRQLLINNWKIFTSSSTPLSNSTHGSTGDPSPSS